MARDRLRPRPRRDRHGLGQGRHRRAAAELDAQARAVPGGRDRHRHPDPGRRRPGRALSRALVKLNKIYTRTGDGGSAGLVDGSRVSKSSLRDDRDRRGRRSQCRDRRRHRRARRRGRSRASCCDIQNDLFDLGADVATPGEVEGALRIVAQPGRAAGARDRRDERRPRAARPASSCRAARPALPRLHLARAIVRRAERAAVALNEAEPLNPQLLAYLNRLSDHLFVAARYVAAKRRRRRAVAAGRDPRPDQSAVRTAGTKTGPFVPFRSRNGGAMALSAIAINCTLKRSGGEPSSTDKMIGAASPASCASTASRFARRSASPTTTSSPASAPTKGRATPGPTSAGASSTATS